MARRLCAALLCCLTACAHARSGPPVITPPRGARSAPQDLSEGGTQRGTVEFALGGVTAGLSATLITLGAAQLARAIEIRDYCEAQRKQREDVILEIPPPLDPACDESILNIDPYTDAKISSALSFAFAAPIAVASGFLFRRAVRIRRDYRANKAAEAPRIGVSPLGAPRGLGLRIEVRF